MAKIRSLNQFEITTDGICYKNQAWKSDWFYGIAIHIDNKSISATTKIRRICCCGNVDDEINESPCPICGNKNWQHARLSGWRYSNESKVHCKVPKLVDGKIIGTTMDVDFDASSKKFVLTETVYDIIDIKDGFYDIRDLHIDSKLLHPLFDELIKNNPNWDKERMLEEKYPIKDLKNIIKNMHDTSIKIALYNILIAIPGINVVTQDLFLVVLQSFINAPRCRYNSIQDFYKSIEAPVILSEVYPVLGLPKNTNLLVLDECDKYIVDVIIQALLHNRITYQELSAMLYNHSALEINGYGFNFADFVRRNIVKHGSKTFDAFIYVYNAGAENIKAANLRRLDAYCNKKGLKNFSQAYNAIIDGDGLGFIAALARESK